MGLIDDLLKALKGATTEEQNDFVGQLIKERALFDALRAAGYTVTTEDPQSRAVDRLGVLSKINKIDVVDLINEITTIETIGNIYRAKIAGIGNLWNNPLFETGDLTDWVKFFSSASNGSFEIVDTIDFFGRSIQRRSLKITANNPAVGLEYEFGQYQFFKTEDLNCLHFIWFGDGLAILCVVFYYLDGTSKTFEYTESAIPVFNREYITDADLDAGKRVWKIGFYPKSESPQNDGKSVYITDVSLTTNPRVTAVSEISLIDEITKIDKINPDADIEKILNGGFETGDFTNWVKIGSQEATVTSADKHTGTYSVFLPKLGDLGNGIKQTFSPPVPASTIAKLGFWVKGLAGLQCYYVGQEWGFIEYLESSEWAFNDVTHHLDPTKSVESIEIWTDYQHDSYVDDVTMLTEGTKTVINRVDEITTLPAITGSVDVTDRPLRILGLANAVELLGSQTWAEAIVGIVAEAAILGGIPSRIYYNGSLIDPRAIRALTVSDQIKVCGSLNEPLTQTNIGGSYFLDTRPRGSQNVLMQRSSTHELLVQLATAGVEIDPRQIRALTSSDVVDLSDKWARQLGGVDIVRITGAAVGASNPLPVRLTNGSAYKDLPREDLAMKYFSNTFASAGDYAILSADASHQHKVYALNYESSADIEVCLHDGTSGTLKFAVRTTKGVFAQTLINPFVGSLNAALNLRAEGAVTVKGYVQYITE